ncbi:hypothetical protein FRC18_002952, partial [Serendipita sp. 400]
MHWTAPNALLARVYPDHYMKFTSPQQNVCSSLPIIFGKPDTECLFLRFFRSLSCGVNTYSALARRMQEYRRSNRTNPANQCCYYTRRSRNSFMIATLLSARL